MADRRYTFTDTITAGRSVTNLIKMIDPMDVPLVSALGLSNEGKFRFQNWPGTKIEWLEDTLAPVSSLLTEDMDTTETGMDVTTGQGAYFSPGDILLVNNVEKVWVSAVTVDTLTVVRGFGATSGTAATTGDAVVRVGIARLEGDDSDPSFTTVPTAPYNYFQIFHREISVTGTEAQVYRYGIQYKYNRELMKFIGGKGAGGKAKGRAGQLMIDLEKTAYYGERVVRDATTPGGMGGLDTFITTNLTDLNGAALDQKTLENAIEDCWQAGGMPDCILTNSWGKRKITSFYKDSVRTERSEEMGGVIINKVDTEFGTLSVLMDRWVPATGTGKLYILQKDLCGWVTMPNRGFFEHKLAISGDYVKGEVLGEYSFVVQNEKAHAIISEFSLTT